MHRRKKAILYRSLSALSSSGSTHINFTMRDSLASSCPRVDANIKLTAQGVKDGIVYPRFKRPLDKDTVAKIWPMPSLEDIEITIMRAQRDVEKELRIQGSKINDF